MSWYENLTSPKIVSPHAQVVAPAGFKEGLKSSKTPVPRSNEQLEQLKINKAWDIAWGPGKQIPVTLFMSYMTGNSLQMIPITQTLMLFTGAISAIISSSEQFRHLKTEKNSNEILIANIVFVLIQFATIAIGLYKLNSMGLIPNKRGDWLSWELPTRYHERSV